jgi:prefoldin subunit 5|tara:strand:+ start:768 stop:950 length:183 start_codon:yes stop_codon:yes gene_type:complete
MKIEEQKEKLQELVNQFNQGNEQIQMLQANNAEIRMQIAKQQGIIEALESVGKVKKNAKT